jgi:hypothetical protein
MKSFTYVAAIALLTAGTAFAQSSNNASTINNSTPTPSATGPADSAGTNSMKSAQPVLGGKQSGSMNMDKSGSMGSGTSMNQSSDMDQSSGGKASKRASMKSKAHHVASARTGGNDSKENQETMQLNRQQVAANGSASMGSSGMNSSGAGNPFNNGSPQQAQGGGANCAPDNPSCGTARQNPAINSSPQHRTYGDQQQ